MKYATEADRKAARAAYMRAYYATHKPKPRKQSAAAKAAKRRYAAKPEAKRKKAEREQLPEVKATRRERHRRYRATYPERDKARYDKSNAKRPATGLAERELLAGRRRPEVCDACGNLPGLKGLHFDHCHTNGWFRGWLCQPCNMALGLLKDDANRLRKLIAYLERTKEGQLVQLALSV
jgi:Recombination endonuclease VII